MTLVTVETGSQERVRPVSRTPLETFLNRRDPMEPSVTLDTSSSHTLFSRRDLFIFWFSVVCVCLLPAPVARVNLRQVFFPLPSRLSIVTGCKVFLFDLLSDRKHVTAGRRYSSSCSCLRSLVSFVIDSDGQKDGQYNLRL